MPGALRHRAGGRQPLLQAQPREAQPHEETPGLGLLQAELGTHWQQDQASRPSPEAYQGALQAGSQVRSSGTRATHRDQVGSYPGRLSHSQENCQVQPLPVQAEFVGKVYGQAVHNGPASTENGQNDQEQAQQGQVYDPVAADPSLNAEVRVEDRDTGVWPVCPHQ